MERRNERGPKYVGKYGDGGTAYYAQGGDVGFSHDIPPLFRPWNEAAPTSLGVDRKRFVDLVPLQLGDIKQTAAALADAGTIARIERAPTTGRLVFHVSNLPADWLLRLANGQVMVNAQAMIE